jgi:hypothetical protein
MKAKLDERVKLVFEHIKKEYRETGHAHLYMEVDNYSFREAFESLLDQARWKISLDSTRRGFAKFICFPVAGTRKEISRNNPPELKNKIY